MSEGRGAEEGSHGVPVPAAKAVLWDMDGTLLDSEKLWDIAVRELSVELGGEMSDETRHALIGSAAANALWIIFAGVGLEPDPSRMAEAGQWLQRRVTELMAGPIPWRPGAQEALRTVRAAGLRTALVTNTQRAVAEVCLNTLGREYFDVSVCGDEVARGKPAPDPYRRATELLDIASEHCVAVEDSPTGSASAAAAGCAVLVIPCEIPVPPAPGYTFRDSLIGLTVADLDALVR